MSSEHTPPVAADHVGVANSHTGASYSPYVSPHQSPTELTLRALVLGATLGIVFAASSVYLAVKVGMTVSASIPIAVLSIAFFRAFAKGSSILENTIVQTTGSAGESLAFGIAAALPALLFMGYGIDLIYAFIVAALGGVLGVLMMIPLRHGLIVQEHGHLTYPEGTACADVLIVGEQGGTNARTVIAGFIVGAAYKFGYLGLKLWRESVETALSWVGPSGKIKGYLGGSVAMEVSPELLGVGYIIGPKIAGVTFAGGVLSYLVLIPAITFFGSNLAEPLVSPSGQLIRDMGPHEIRNHYVLYIGAGAVATGGLVSLIRSLPTILSAFRRGLQTFLASRSGMGAPQLLRTEQDLPITVVLIGSIGLVLTIWLVPILGVNFIAAVLILVCGFFFVTVSARITGEIGSSSNPISGMVVATLLITCLTFLMFGWTGADDRFMALTTAAIVGIAASVGGTTAQDLKTAYLVGGTPKKQQVSLFVGVLSSAIFIGGTLVLLNEGATAIVPELHTAPRISSLTEDVKDQRVFRFQASPQTLETKGITLATLQKSAWAAGHEVRQTEQGLELRSWGTPSVEELGAITVGQGVRLAELGPIVPATERAYRVGYVREGGDVPPGKYLVNSAGDIEYLVDPGIGGRIASVFDHRLTRYDAPKARLFSLIIDGILTQQLPWSLVLLGVFIALMLELCGVSSLPFAVGVYLPISTSAPIFVGGVIRHFVDRLRGVKEGAEAEFSPGVLLSSGYIAGGAIAGVVLAILAIPAGGAWLSGINLAERVGGLVGLLGESEHRHPVWSNLWALLAFGALAAFLLRTGIRGQSGARQAGEKA